MFNDIFQLLANFKAEDVEKEKNVSLSPVYPPKDDATDEEKNAYKAYLENMKKVYDFFDETATFVTDPNKCKTESLDFIKQSVKEAQRELEADDPYRNYKLHTLTEAQITERKNLRDMARLVACDYESKAQLYAHILNASCKDFENGKTILEDNRLYATILCTGCKNTDEYMHRVNVFAKGTKEEKQKEFEKIILTLRNTMNDLSVSKDDHALIGYMRHHIMDATALAECDGAKLEKVASVLGVSFNDKCKSVIGNLGSIGNTISGSTVQRLFTMANPYYAVMDERDHDYFINAGIPDVPELQEGGSNLREMHAGFGNAFKLFLSYNNTAQMSMGKDYEKDFIALYAMNHPGSQFVSEKGEILDPLTDSEEIGKRLSENKNFMIKDARGNLLSRVSVPSNGTLGLATDDDRIDSIDFENDPTGSIRYIKNEMKKLTGWFNHQEYKNLKAAINSFESKLGKNPDSKDALVAELGDLAKKYVESKFMATTPNKNQTTYNREIFFNKLYKQAELYKNPDAFTLPPATFEEIADEKRNPIEIPEEEINQNKDIKLDNIVEKKDDEVIIGNDDKDEIVKE